MGGWSSVYAAVDRQLNRRVAVKVLHRFMAENADHVKRFQREAESAGAINNIHVCTIHDTGVLENGQPFIVMELLEGKPLSEVLKNEGRLGVHRAVRVFMQACLGFAAAHAQGIVHRDIKPSNIFLRDDGNEDFVKIVDFGLAKLLAGQQKIDDLTATGETFGTPSYMSPEQLTEKDLDARSDIYSLGCVMYEALTGYKAVSAETMYGCVVKQLNEKPKSFAQVRSDLYIPDGLERLVFKAIEKDPNARFNSMNELQEHLEGCLTGSTNIRKNREAQLSAGIAVVLTIGIAAFCWQAFSTTAPRPVHEQDSTQTKKIVHAESKTHEALPLRQQRTVQGSPPIHEHPRMREEPGVNRIAQAESELDHLFAVMHVRVQPRATEPFVADPDVWTHKFMEAKLKTISSFAPTWVTRTGNYAVIQHLQEAMSELDRQQQQHPSENLDQQRSKVLDDVAAAMNLNVPFPDEAQLPKLPLDQALPKRMQQKIQRLQIEAPAWVARGGDQSLVQSTMQRVDKLINQR